jgi:hypothetical protein
MSDQASSSTAQAEAQDDILKTQYSPEEIAQFNRELENKTPQEILVWAIDHLDGLFQTTAFGLCVYSLISFCLCKTRWTDRGYVADVQNGDSCT